MAGSFEVSCFDGTSLFIHAPPMDLP